MQSNDPFPMKLDPTTEARLLELFGGSESNLDCTVTTSSPTNTFAAKSSVISLPGGWLLQFGVLPARAIDAGATSAATNVKFPLPFPEGCVYFNSTGYPDTTWTGFYTLASNGQSTNGETSFANGGTAQNIINGHWIAIGR